MLLCFSVAEKHLFSNIVAGTIDLLNIMVGKKTYVLIDLIRNMIKDERYTSRKQSDL